MYLHMMSVKMSWKDTTCKGVGTGPAGPVLAGPLFNSLAYMVKQNCMFE